MSDLTNKQKKEFAKQLVINEPSITIVELATRTGATRQTVAKWHKEERWADLAMSLLTSRETELRRLYLQLKAFNDAIESRPVGERFPDSKEADALGKITAAIRSMETDMNISDKMTVGKEFLTYVRQVETPAKASEIAKIFDHYMKTQF